MPRVKLEPTSIRYSTQTSTCEKGQWQPALALLCRMLGMKLESTILICYRTRISACEKVQRRTALALLCEMLGVRLEPIIRYSAWISACVMGQWQPALALPCNALWAELEPTSTTAPGPELVMRGSCRQLLGCSARRWE